MIRYPFMQRLFQSNREWQGTNALVPVDICFSVFEVFVWAVFLGGAVTMTLFYFEYEPAATTQMYFWAVGVPTLMAFCAGLCRGLPFPIRFALIELALLLLVIITTVTGGLMPNTSLYAVMLLAGLTLFYGFRTGLLGLGVVATLLTASAWCWNNGYLPLAMTQGAVGRDLLDFKSPLVWIRVLPVTALFMIAVMTVLRLVLQRLQDTNQALLKDIEQRTKAEDLLKASHAFRERVFDSSPTAIVVMDPDSKRFLDFNQAAIDVYGFSSREEMVGKTPSDISAPTQYDGNPSDDLARVRIKKALEEGSIVFEWRHKRPNGALWDAEVHLMSFQDGSRKLLQHTIRDITERKRIEQALRDSEAKFRVMFESSLDAIRVSEKGKHVFANPAFLKLFGYETNDEIMHASVLDQIAPSHHQQIKDIIRRRSAGESVPNVYQTRARRKDGSEFDEEVNVSSFEINGEAYSIAIVRDITERKKAEDAVRQSEARLREIFDHTSDIIFTARVEEGGDFVYEDINPAVEVIGLTVEAFKAGTKTPHDIFSREAADMILTKYRRCVEARSLIVVDQTFSTPIGQRSFSTKLVPVFEADGARVIRLIGFSRDMTEMKHAEQSLRKSEVKYRSIFENALEAIFQTAVDDRYLSVNPAMARLFGYTSPEEMISTVTSIERQVFVDPEDRRQVMQTVREKGSIENKEIRVRHRDGHEIWVLLNAHVVKDSNGATLFLEGSGIDITEHKRNAELQMDKAKADAANRAKSVFLANMSHEIRTPLNAILGFTQLMGRDPELSPAQREHLSIIGRSGEHLLALINDILEMSKIEAQQVKLHTKRFNLVGMARDLHSMFSANAAAKGLRFTIEIGPELPDQAVGDEGKLRQVFVNLLGNAIKFTSTGHVLFRLRAGTQQESHWQLLAEFEDSGPGIGAAEMNRLFQPFEQTSLGIKSGTGTGLGLAISREFARMMGGDITLESEAGKGSVFRVKVTLGKALAEGSNGEKTRKLPTPRQIASAQNCRVLVVDDLEDNRRLFRELMVPFGFEVREASTGADAVVQFNAWQPKLVLMDLRMPGMDGYEASRLIRAHPQGDQVKIVCLSASVFSEDRDKALAAGADRFMPKPFDEEQFWETLGELLDLQFKQASVTRVSSQSSVELAQTSLLPVLPLELESALRRAVLELDLDQIMNLIGQVRVLDTAYADKLAKLAGKYDYDGLIAMLPDRKTTPS